MPVGLIVNGVSVVLGGLAGALVGKKIPDKTARNLTIILGICSMCIGVENISKVNTLPPVIMAVLLGYVIGDLLNLEDKIAAAFQALFNKVPVKSKTFNMDQFVMVVVLFCASGFGIFGVLTFAAGFRIAEMKKILIGNLIPALILVIPFSYLWSLLPF